MAFTHVHSSGRYDIPGARLLAPVKKYNSIGELITYTEAATPSRWHAIHIVNADTGFGMVRGNHGSSNDCVISYKKDHFDLLHEESFKTNTPGYWRVGGAHTPPVWATIAVLREKATKKVYVVSVVHLAAHVEGAMPRPHATNRTFAWYGVFRQVMHRVNQLQKQYNARVLFVADFNLNFKKRIWRRLVKTLAPLYRLNWKDFNFAGGTHAGGRVIDATLIRGKVFSGGATLMTDDASSDHRPYKERIV